MKNLRQQNGFVCDNEFYVSGNPVYFASFIDICVSLLIPFCRRLFWPNFHHTLNKKNLPIFKGNLSGKSEYVIN